MQSSKIARYLFALNRPVGCSSCRLLLSRHIPGRSLQPQINLQHIAQDNRRIHSTPISLSQSETISQTGLNRIVGVDIFYNESKTQPIIEPLSGLRPPSVTKILNDTRDAPGKLALEQWEAKMIKQMGEEAFAEYRQGLFRRGHAIHAGIQQRLFDEEDSEVDEEVQKYMDSVSPHLANFHDILTCEKKYTHQTLFYCGVVDCVAQYESAGLFVIDWKTSERKKTKLNQTFDLPLQIAAYVGLWNSLHPDEQISQGMLVMMYPDGSPCDVIKINEKALKMYWREWKLKLKLYWQLHSDRVELY